MIEWDGNLLIGSQFNFNNTSLNQQIMQWNGSSCVLFSEQEMPSITDFKIYNKQLYCSGTGPTRTSNFSYVNIYNPITKHWDLIGEKLNRSVNVLYVLNDSLFAGGAFNKEDSSICNFIAQLNAKNTSNHDIKNYSTSVKFNSDKKEIIVSVFDTNLTISITDIQGKLVYKKTLLQPTSIIEDFNYNGLFIWQITAGSKTINAGKLCYLTTTVGGAPYAETTRMAFTDADASLTSTGLLAICLSASTGNDQIRPFAMDGYVNIQNSFIANKSGTPTDDLGKPVYIGTTSGEYDMTAPSGSGQIIRIVGHVIAAGASVYTIYFRPDNTWIEL
jgi:hypothetical protein